MPPGGEPPRDRATSKCATRGRARRAPTSAADPAAAAVEDPHDTEPGYALNDDTHTTRPAPRAPRLIRQRRPDGPSQAEEQRPRQWVGTRALVEPDERLR